MAEGLPEEVVRFDHGGVCLGEWFEELDRWVAEKLLLPNFGFVRKYGSLDK